MDALVRMPAYAMLMYVHFVHGGGHANPILGGFLVIVGILVVAILKAFQGRGDVPLRETALQALADKLAFTSFSPEPNYEFVMGWSFLGNLSQGEDRYAYNILEGTYHDQKLYVFDYHFRTCSPNTEERNYTVFMLIEKESFPQILIEPASSEDLLGHVANLFTNNDIKFESAEFSRTFRVRSRDKKFAYDVCNPQMMEYLLANRDLRIEIQGPAILLVFDPQVPVDQIEFNLERIAQIRSLLPQYLFTTK